MKTKSKIIIGIIALAAVFAVIWWFSPKVFLSHVNPNEIASIEVFNGNTGKGFTITEQEDIAFITEAIQSVSMKKGKITVRMGYKYKLSFVKENGTEIDHFILKSPTTIEKGFVLYKCDDALQPAENYLADLEKKQLSTKG